MADPATAHRARRRPGVAERGAGRRRGGVARQGGTASGALARSGAAPYGALQRPGRRPRPAAGERLPGRRRSAGGTPVGRLPHQLGLPAALHPAGRHHRQVRGGRAGPGADVFLPQRPVPVVAAQGPVAAGAQRAHRQGPVPAQLRSAQGRRRLHHAGAAGGRLQRRQSGVPRPGAGPGG
ncbi:MAG TPA: hypothetical protein DD977_01465, partial [Alcanivorax sp.]|nr:hypothetical protein [Alcanivorax sp.]